MADILLSQPYYQSTSSACLTDVTAPTFSGISALTAQINGSLLASWSAATDATTPIHYDVYVQASTATGLFTASNLALSTKNTSTYIFILGDNSRLMKDVTYYVGVRARDAVGNVNTNLVSLNAVSAGVLDDDFATLLSDLLAVEADLAQERSQSRGVFAIDNANLFTGQLWFEFKGQVATSLLGAGSYTVYDADDNAVAGLTQSGITANVNGVYVITPASAAGLEPFVNYRIKITIVYDSVSYTSYKGFTVGE